MMYKILWFMIDNESEDTYNKLHTILRIIMKRDVYGYAY